MLGALCVQLEAKVKNDITLCMHGVLTITLRLLISV